MNVKSALWTIFGILILVLGTLGVASLHYNNAVPNAELFVAKQVADCEVTTTNGIQAIIKLADVDENTKGFLVDLVASASGNEKNELNSAYESLLQDDPMPFMFLMSQMGSTNFTITSENVQREISSQIAAMTTCSLVLNRAQMELMSLLGRDAAGNTVKFPQTALGLVLSKYPSQINDPQLVDNDGDGKLTVLDYRPPVSVYVKDSYRSGDVIEFEVYE